MKIYDNGYVYEITRNVSFVSVWLIAAIVICLIVAFCIGIVIMSNAIKKKKIKAIIIVMMILFMGITMTMALAIGQHYEYNVEIVDETAITL